MEIFINKLLIPNRFLPSQSLNHFVWLCFGRNDAVYQVFKANAARTSLRYTIVSSPHLPPDFKKRVIPTKFSEE